MKPRAFTLTELLVVISIIAILAAVLFPAFLAVRASAYQITASGALDQIGQAELMYCGDNDDTFMPAMYTASPQVFQAWFGQWVKPGPWVKGTGLLTPYEKKSLLHDMTANMQDYLGDHSGFGYNWGFLGSDFHVTGNMSGFPNCRNEATTTSLSSPSGTVVFATSGYYNAPWLPNGDGLMYDFGFIDPVSYCAGNPNVDFRHISSRVVNVKQKTITFPGNAVVGMADGHMRIMKIDQLKDSYFYRTTNGQGPSIPTNGLP
jgi:prepilin-type N-terminal cleavage/methylation domain-containing protein